MEVKKTTIMTVCCHNPDLWYGFSSFTHCSFASSVHKHKRQIIFWCYYNNNFEIIEPLKVSQVPFSSRWLLPLLCRRFSVCFSPTRLLLLLSPVLLVLYLRHHCQDQCQEDLPLCFFLNLFIYFWLHWVFVAARGLSLVVASGGYSSLRCTCFSLWWLLLLQSTGSRCTGFSSCGTQAK